MSYKIYSMRQCEQVHGNIDKWDSLRDRLHYNWSYISDYITNKQPQFELYARTCSLFIPLMEDIHTTTLYKDI